jgi:hypothetical protein
MMAVLLAIVGVRSAAAQDLDFTAVPKITIGLTNQGAVAALNTAGLLSATTPTSLNGFTARDVAVGGGAIFSVGLSAASPTGFALIRLGPTSAAGASLGDGTFSLPQTVPLSDSPRAIAVGDIDLDGLVDVVVAEGGINTTGQIEVFSGAFLQAGVLRLFDQSDIADVRSQLSGNPAGARAPIPTSNGNRPISITLERLDGDAFLDVAYVTTDLALGGEVEVIFTNSNASFSDGDPTTGPGSGTTTPEGPALPVSAAAGLILSTNGPAPDLIDADVLNIADTITTVVDATPDIAVATSTGIALIPTIADTTGAVNADATFDAAVTVAAGTRPVGVLIADVTRDNLNDVISLNAGSGNVSTNVANAGGGYGPPSRSIPVGANPISISLINFNNDGIPDVLVGNAPGLGAGTVVALVGNGSGGFTTARTRTGVNPVAVAAGVLRAGSQGEDVVFGQATGLNFLANTSGGFAAVFVKIFSAVSLAASIDRTGAGNDVVVIEQAAGLVFILLNISGGSAGPQVAAIDLNDLFSQFISSPTSATTFRDAQTNLINVAITDNANPTATTGVGQLIILLNDGTGTFTDFGAFRQFVLTPGATNILAGDFNNDDRDDLVFIDTLSNFAGVGLNDGANFFLRIQFRETGGFVPVSARIGDVNDDDRLDLVVAHQGALGVQGNQSVISVLIGDGTGNLNASGPLLQVPNFALSLVGGVANFETNNIPRIVDFNADGFPDFAVATTRGGTQNVAGVVPAVTLLVNRADSPGNFNVAPPIALIDDTATTNPNLQLEGVFGGPGVVSGRGGDPVTNAAGLGIGFGGANYTLAVGDFNADGSPDLSVCGAFLAVFDANGDGIGDGGTAVSGLPGVPVSSNFRSTIRLFGNETAGTVRVARPLRAAEYTLDFALGVNASLNPFNEGGDAFVATASGNFLALNNLVPDLFHISLNGNIWVDVNTSSILNHAPIVTIARADLNAPIGQGRKEIITSGQSVTVRVTAADVDSDTLTFSLVAPPTGENPPSFVSINPTTGLITINSADINRGPGVARFRIGVQASDAATVGAGGRLPLTGRDFFTLVVLPNSPPTIAPISNQTVEAGRTVTLNLSITDPDANQTITNTVTCDRGNFASISGNTLTLAPQTADVGTATCTVTARDQFGLTSRAAFTVTVTAANRPPTIANISDVTVTAGQSVTVPISATDPDTGDTLTLSLVSAPAFVTISDNRNGTGNLRISPDITATAGGPVTVQVTDRAGATARTTFNVNVRKAVQIQAASYAKPNLFISGVGFGASGATVTVNGQNVTARVIGQNDNSITVKGSKKKLGLRTGPNQIQVTSGGTASNTFVINLLSSEE